MQGPRVCDFGSGEISSRDVDTTSFDPELTVRLDSESVGRTFRLAPETGVGEAGSTGGGCIACDGGGRRYFGCHDVLGYLVTFGADGRELWRVDIPGFRSIVSEVKKLRVATGEAILALLDDHGSVTTKLVTSGPYLAVETRTGDLYFHDVYHRSGAYVGRIGPWNGIITEASDGGWKVIWSSKTEPGSYFFPDREGVLRVRDQRTEVLAQHLLAAVTPTRSGAGLSWDLCPGGAADIGRLLGDAWSPTLAKLAIRVRTELGPEWLAGVAARIAASEESDLTARLVAAGVDVEMMKVAREIEGRPRP